MKVVVIGGTGHIGTYLVPRLAAAGHDVVTISRGRRSPYMNHAAWSEVEMLQADREAEDRAGTFAHRVAAERPDAVVDLLCFTSSSAEQLVAALAPLDCYLLHCGTIWVHGAPVEVPVTEETRRQPFGEYGTQKAAVEELLLGEARRGKLRSTILHPGHIVGPGWPPINPAGNGNVKVFELLARGEELALPNFGLETVHHVHADDVAQAFEKALAHPGLASGEAFHVVSERALTLKGYAEAVYRWFGQTPRLSFLPWETWAAGWSQSDADTTWEHIARSPSISIDKAKNLLGYQPRYGSLEAVFEAVAWLVSTGQIDIGDRKMSF
ncbi:MAG TPA: NAD-dependent epimerase/dehydratase family protein [Acidimicrobiales bacterium]|nr:NAD-dependent epimerase/dehydratase family protein [Acidimicrobiales bacterium]